MASKGSNNSAFILKGLTGLSLSSTISKDNMKGQQARNAQLLKEFGQKNQTPSLRSGLNAKGQQSGDVENLGSALPTNVEYGDEPEEYEEEEEEGEGEEGVDEAKVEDPDSELRAAIASDVDRRHSGWRAQISVQERYERALVLKRFIKSNYIDLPPKVLRSGAFSYEKKAFERSLTMDTYELRVGDCYRVEQYFRKHLIDLRRISGAG